MRRSSPVRSSGSQVIRRCTQSTADAINDWSCRFKDGFGQRQGREPDSACTLSEDGLFRFVNATSALQFCGLVNLAIEFPPGDTLVSARVRDVRGNLSAAQQILVRVGTN